jgi:two-component system, chemotaxis family, response regulator PixG
MGMIRGTKQFIFNFYAQKILELGNGCAMATEITVMTKITQDLMVLHQQRATGELVITQVRQTSSQWKLYFYLGRVVYATGGSHPVRRWYRAFNRCCPVFYRSGWLTKARSHEELWEIDLLNQALSQQLINSAQARAIVQSIVQEVMFAVVGQKAVSSQWNAGKQVAQQNVLLSMEQVLREAYQLREAWQGSGIGFLQELLLQFSPDLAPVLRNASQLEPLVSPESYKGMTRMVQGQMTLWDVALQMQKPLPSLIKAMLPLVRQGVIELREVADLPTPYRQVVVPPPPESILPKTLIACIDDSPLIGQIITQILQPAGYEVLTILNPLQGIAALLERKPSFIFLDLVMPNTNGYELCTFLRKTSAFQDTPIVILTGHDGVIDRVRAKLVGSSEFLAKPPESAKVLQIVQKYLGSNSTEPDSPVNATAV